MASRSFSKALRSQAAARQLSTSTSSPAVQRRGFVSALGAATTARPSTSALTVAGGYGGKVYRVQQARGVKTIDFAGHKETVYGTSNFVGLERVDRFHILKAFLWGDPERHRADIAIRA